MKKCKVCGDKAEYMWYGEAFCKPCIEEALEIRVHSLHCDNCGKPITHCFYSLGHHYCCKECAFEENKVYTILEA